MKLTILTIATALLVVPLSAQRTVGVLKNDTTRAFKGYTLLAPITHNNLPHRQ